MDLMIVEKLPLEGLLPGPPGNSVSPVKRIGVFSSAKQMLPACGPEYERTQA